MGVRDHPPPLRIGKENHSWTKTWNNWKPAMSHPREKSTSFCTFKHKVWKIYWQKSLIFYSNSRAANCQFVWIIRRIGTTRQLKNTILSLLAMEGAEGDYPMWRVWMTRLARGLQRTEMTLLYLNWRECIKRQKEGKENKKKAASCSHFLTHSSTKPNISDVKLITKNVISLVDNLKVKMNQRRRLCQYDYIFEKEPKLASLVLQRRRNWLNSSF